MRRRLVVVLVGLTVAVIACYGIPRAYFIADLVRDQEQHDLTRSTELIAALVQERAASDREISAEWLSRHLDEGDEASLVLGATSVTAGEAGPGSDSDLTATAPVADSGTLTLTRDGAVVEGRVSEAIAPLVLIGLGLVVASVLVGVLVARRLSRPFQELATAATRLGTGRFDVDVPHYAVPEAEAIGEALRTGGARLDRLVRREREFAVNASHELLTPITGIRLELEDLALWPETAPEVAREIALAVESLDGLAGRVRSVLEGDRAERLEGGKELDLGALTAAAVERWRPAVEAGGRDLHYATGFPVLTRLPAEPVRQILDGLLAQAHREGEGTITVDTAALPTHLRVRVADEGRRRGASDVIHRRRDAAAAPDLDSELAVAAETAESLGGYVLLDEGELSRVVLMLPRGEN
jgi:signal transduction histidine kinase